MTTQTPTHPTTDPIRVLQIVGSPRGSKSTSASLLDALAVHLPGTHIEQQMAHTAIRTPSLLRALLDAVAEADVIVLAFPLYIDNLPYVTLRVLEAIAADRADQRPGKRQRLLCIANCGFPEAHHNDLALMICQHFAAEAGFEWVGGLATGKGGVIDGKPFASVKHIMPNVERGLAGAAAALLNNAPVPPSVIDDFAAVPMPHRLYTFLGTLNWYRQARRHQVRGQLRRRPYTEDV